MVILRKHYTCFNCGERYKRDTSEIVIDAKEKVKCPNCGGYPMSLASVEQIVSQYPPERGNKDGAYHELP